MNKNLKVFLEQVSKGCISGQVCEWPQLVSAVIWALEEMEKDKAKIKVLVEAVKQAKKCLKENRRLSLQEFQQIQNVIAQAE